jgi:hypothetical protein
VGWGGVGLWWWCGVRGLGRGLRGAAGACAGCAGAAVCFWSAWVAAGDAGAAAATATTTTTTHHRHRHTPPPPPPPPPPPHTTTTTTHPCAGGRVLADGVPVHPVHGAVDCGVGGPGQRHGGVRVGRGARAADSGRRGAVHHNDEPALRAAHQLRLLLQAGEWGWRAGLGWGWGRGGWAGWAAAPALQLRIDAPLLAHTLLPPPLAPLYNSPHTTPLTPHPTPHTAGPEGADRHGEHVRAAAHGAAGAGRAARAAAAGVARPWGRRCARHCRRRPRRLRAAEWPRWR